MIDRVNSTPENLSMAQNPGSICSKYMYVWCVWLSVLMLEKYRELIQFKIFRTEFNLDSGIQLTSLETIQFQFLTYVKQKICFILLCST